MRRGSPPGSKAHAASAVGTARYRDRFADQFAADFYRPIFDDVVASSIGLGTYLGDCTDADDQLYSSSIRAALERGINLIDSAINYRCQRSERAIGSVVGEMMAAGQIRRDEVILCTKGGYVPLDGSPPASRDEYLAYLRHTFFEPGIMAPEDVVGGGHSLAPTFLAQQIDHSRANLGVRTIDVYYLHNPEQQLDAVQPARFRTVLRHAFAMLEERVAAGDIGCYGCATWNGLRVPPDARGHLNLSELVAIARDVAGDAHHFRVAQLPINLAMSEGVRTPTQRLGSHRVVPLLQAAAELGIAIVTSATLMQSRLTTGLPAELREAFPSLRTDAQRAIAFVRSLPAVTSALVGMRSSAHLDENLGAAHA
jgi:aryl-alcohol dehydrogenase-like predicted oxidoreductase